MEPAQSLTVRVGRGNNSAVPPLFFTHVMKTGGVSLTHRIRREVGTERVFPVERSNTSSIAQKSLPEFLLALDDAERAAIRLFSVHQPAWVAFAVVPDAIRFTALRDPIERTISHLRQLAGIDHVDSDLESLYDNEGWRSRLANYQTQIFGVSRDHTAPLPDTTGFTDEQLRETMQQGLQQVLGTAIHHPIEVNADVATRAQSTLDRYDAVGTTDTLESLARQISQISGLDLSGIEHKNRSHQPAPVSNALRRALEADNTYDLALYEAAKSRAASG